MKKYFLFFFLAVSAFEFSFGQTFNNNFWVPNGEVKSIINQNDTVYVAGKFSRVSPPTGPAVPINLVSSDDTLPGFPHVCGGTVRAVISDNNGGWYIGGNFSCVGEIPRNNLAHIKNDFSVDPVFNPNISGGDVYSIFLYGNTLYFSGDFDSVAHTLRKCVAAIDLTGNTLKPLSTTFLSASAVVRTIVVSGNNIYIGGNFTSVAGTARPGIASFDTTGNVYSLNLWNPGNVSGCSNLAGPCIINSLLLSGNLIYAGGEFDTLGGCGTRMYLAALDTSTGIHTNWNPSRNPAYYGSAPTPSGFPVLSLALSGDTMYAGGMFNTIANVARGRLAAFRTSDTGSLLPWTANLTLPAPPCSLNTVLIQGNTLYCGGNFTAIAGTPRNYLGAVDRLTGFVSPWNPNPNSAQIYSLAVSGDTLYAGGDFTGVKGIVRNKLYRFNASSGVIDPVWNPDVSAASPALYIYALAIKDTTIFIGGNFLTVGASARNRLAEIGKGGAGSLTPWNPGLSANAINAMVFSTNKDTLFVGGDFTTAATLGASNFNRLAALNPNTNFAYNWNPNSDGTVNSLAIEGGNLYAGGTFGNIGGMPHSRIVNIGTATALPSSWNPGASAAGAVLTIVPDPLNNLVYIGGSFTSLQSRSRIAAMDATTGLVNAFNPSPNSSVYSMVLVNDSILFTGGLYTSIGLGAFAVIRNRAAAINCNTNAILPWNPNLSGQVNSLAQSGTGFFIGGQFLCADSMPSSYFAGYSGLCINSFTGASATPDSICPGDTTTLSACCGSSYSWLPVTGIFSPNSGTTLATPLVTTTYTVTVSGLGGCAEEATAKVTMNIGTSFPSIDTCGASTVLCFGDTGCLSTSSVAWKYLWSPFGDTTAIIHPLLSGSYSLKVTDSSGCSSYSTDTTVITVYPLPPQPNITQLSFTPPCTITTSFTGYKYQWYVDGFPLVGDTLQSYSGYSGMYSVCITDTSTTCQNCSSTFVLDCPSGVNELEQPVQFFISPNPFSESTQLSLFLKKPGKVSIAVFDILGNTILIPAKNESLSPGKYEFDIDINVAGVYFVEMISEDGTFFQKIIRF